jgi:hypothetical protein
MDKLTADDVSELGNLFRGAAIALGDWRIKNRAGLSRAQWDELDEREITLLNTVSSLYTSAVGLILEGWPGRTRAFAVQREECKISGASHRHLQGGA